jgi:polysaccharide biosynthesis transport protein
MDLVELLHVLRQRKLIAIVVFLATLGAAFAYLYFTDPVYEAESSLALSPGSADELVFFSTVDTLVPLYADTASSPTTRAAAEDDIGRPLGDVFIETFEGTPIFRIRARSTDPEHAAESAQAVTNALLDRVRTDEIGVSGLDLEQIDRPVTPTIPVYPRRNLTIAVAIMVGLVLGLGGALLRESLTNRVETLDDLARVAGAPALAEIPMERALESVRSPEAFVRGPQLRVVSEAFRDLRTALLYSGNNVRSVLITSPEGRHGKTTVSVGLAVTLARLGARTVLVDGDLRRGRISDMLGLRRAPGLTEVLMGTPLPSAIRSTSLQTLDVLTGGELLSDPSELIERRFHQVLDELSRSYQAIVIDGTPTLPINDARIMASFATAAIIVATPHATSRSSVRVVLERLSTIGVQPAGVVLNKSRRRRLTDYYSYLRPEPETKRRRRGRRRADRAPTSA